MYHPSSDLCSSAGWLLSCLEPLQCGGIAAAFECFNALPGSRIRPGQPIWEGPESAPGMLLPADMRGPRRCCFLKQANCGR